MVFFNDQLTQQTPPVADKLPVIGQVSLSQVNGFRIFGLVFYCIVDDYFDVNDKHNLLSSSALYAWPK